MAQDFAGNSSTPMDDARQGALELPTDEAEASPTASILIVDDDPGQRLLMRTALEGKGFEVIEAVDGVEGCQLYEKHRPDLLLVDLMMPRMDGYELCRELRGHARSVNVPIVVATGCEDIASIVRAYEAGATDFVPKPVNWVVLSHRLRYILRASRAFAELSRDLERSNAAEEEAEATNGSKSEPVTKGDEPRAPPNAMIGVSGMISDRSFGSLSEKATLSFEWVELDTIVRQISRLQFQRSVAKAHGNIARFDALAAELAAAQSERDRLISQIGNGIGT
jgi:CheY-like chemotaxis protein